ncbi:MAG: hypothetical protein EBX41_10095 [Chitinophagia bacterium]|nr:hypothetical protein [Chitinophagia bacterium]
MAFFSVYLRIKSKIRKVIKIKPIYNKFCKHIDKIKEIQKVKQIEQENNLRKNFLLNDFVKERFIKRYSI